MSNRLYILLDTFLIKVFLLQGVVFAHSCYRGLLLGIGLVDTYKCKLLLFNIYLPCNIYILRGFFRCFLKFFQLVFSFFRPGAARALLIFIQNWYIFKVNKEALQLFILQIQHLFKTIESLKQQAYKSNTVLWILVISFQ